MNIFFARGNQNIDTGPQGQLIPKKLFHPPPPPGGHQVGPLDTMHTPPPEPDTGLIHQSLQINHNQQVLVPVLFDPLQQVILALPQVNHP